MTPVVWYILYRRLRVGKEHPTRWREKLGYPTHARPKGRLVWLHAVGLGELLSTRPLIQALRDRDPDLQFLVTSGTASAAQAFQAQMPPNTIHQFLPMDIPAPVARFFNHWQPDISIWVEQDVWPNMVFQTARRGIPLVLVNARLHATSAARHKRVKSLYQAVYGLFDVITAQDDISAKNL
ncbi:MAG: glycosyltransferase N-terminal domain-containing protein, partial [Pseudomonadota bacterium]